MDEQSQEHPLVGAPSRTQEQRPRCELHARRARQQSYVHAREAGSGALVSPGGKWPLKGNHGWIMGIRGGFEAAPRQRVGMKGKVRGVCCGYEFNVH